MSKFAFSPPSGCAGGVKGLKPLVLEGLKSSPSKKLDSLLRVATIDAADFHAVLLQLEAEDGSNESQYGEYIIKVNNQSFFGLVDFGFDLKYAVDGVEQKNSKGYARRFFLALFQQKPTKAKLKEQVQKWCDTLNELTGNSPHTKVPADFLLPHKHLCECLSFNTVKKIAEILFGIPSQNPNYWAEHGAKMDAFWPFGTWNRDAMNHYGATEEVLAAGELDGEDAEEQDEEDDAKPAAEETEDETMEEDGNDEDDKDNADGDSFIVDNSDDDDDEDGED